MHPNNWGLRGFISLTPFLTANYHSQAPNGTLRKLGFYVTLRSSAKSNEAVPTNDFGSQYWMSFYLQILVNPVSELGHG